MLDFGLAKALAETAADVLTIDGEVAGTPAFMSPEQASGRHVDARSDVFSLGVILYRLLVGEPPYDPSGTQQELMRRVSQGQLRRPRDARPDLPVDLEAILLTALAHDPARRYATAGELSGDLQNYLAGRPLVATHPDAARTLDMAELLVFLDALQAGDFGRRLPAGLPGRAGEIVHCLHTLQDRLAAIAGEVARVTEEIGVDGRLGGWVEVLPPQGQWKRMVDAVNTLALSMTSHVRDVNKTLECLQRGDASREVSAPLARGELLQQRQAVNALVRQLRESETNAGGGAAAAKKP